MTASLPSFADYEPFRIWRADPAQWLPIAHDIARSHGLACTTPQVFATGTNLVMALDDILILKIFPPFLRSQFVSERGSLAQLRGQLRIAIPETVVEGERDGWPYLVITRLPGVLGADAWPSLPEADKERVLAEIGETIVEVQRVPAGPLASIEPGWNAFMRRQIEGCRARHTRLGLPQKFLDGLDDLLRDAAALTALDGPPVTLTGEYIPENFLLSRDGSGWRLAGLIDFGDVMTGMREYDLLGPSAFMTAGMPRRVRSLFEGFGYSAADITPDLKRRLMALMLLHRASDPVRHICIEGWQEKASDLFELQDLLWPI
ncbi:aminoglycoside 3'-phosphotransferase/choline kinase family protein [Bradyrhizobium sp. SRL28]|uniref:aminoglycoside phosphotransferase family protein n=1 Tax=Bradyrhizobium sp. SRL28 TaxID=2836178 RepID=UPI001BDE68DB|nr:aminoglycoside 3'-phosphotransferase/choline kinase family protein [Bradyrhizobium sp. SRL28]MBT1513394.1 aminoglycoside 3'-phosphotransferase/choline kinase family protein [Bradyrhizobium sp. SRL28]